MKVAISPVVLALVCAAVASAAPCPSASVTGTVAPGLEHLTLCRGEVATTTSYRVLVGVFDRQSDADRMLERLSAHGISAVPVSGGGGYRIVAAGFSQREEAERLRADLERADGAKEEETAALRARIEAAEARYQEALRKARVKPNHVEGYPHGDWLLMDYVDFVVHIFTPRSRNHYDLERLWGDASSLEVE